MSRTIRRKTGKQPSFNAGYCIAWAYITGTDIQDAHDQEVKWFKEWESKSSRDGYEGHCTRSQRLKKACNKALRNEWRVQKAATRKLSIYDNLGPYDCGCELCDEEAIHAPYVDYHTAGHLAVNRWDFY